MEQPSWASVGVDLDRPSVARVYDYYLGGSHNFAVERTTAPLTMRTRLEIEELLGGFEPVAPGLVFLPLWRPDSPVDVGDHPERFGLAVVGRWG